MTLKIIGAGFGRTGTLSLKAALEELGLGPSYHMVEVIQKPEAPKMWVDALDGPADWDKIFDGYTSTVDWPACHFWRELMDYYPEAKVILSVRDANAWFESTQATIFPKNAPAGISEKFGPVFEEFRARILYSDVGGDPHDREGCVAAFHRHTATVTKTVPPERLLVYEASQGWAPLCEFLGIPVPQTPYPKSNSTEEFKTRFRPSEDQS